MSQEFVLLVDDEENITNLARMYLERDGFVIQTVADGCKALEVIHRDSPALVVLDLMLPGMDGFEICRKLRAENNQVPIILLTARDDDVDKILGLELGADDYMTKPFNPRELVARVKAILRRMDRPQTSDAEKILVADLVIDLARREVRQGEHQIVLRRNEFELFKVLAEHRGFVLTRERLLNLAWGYDFAGQTRTVDVHVAQLRNKLKKTKVIIDTVTGIGYKLVA
ncbi:MAG: two-component system OmpR family alkaline phosphatase synthesis response regulator PhoP [Chloroflexi bacterium]|nr:MAG: two-component system OmpR family alkaline phosphatase synthesis response regulator PhoP [Chloroflexota bacterium]MBA4376165.1 DNA-binding response regulator [Anaerolinea sp.]